MSSRSHSESDVDTLLLYNEQDHKRKLVLDSLDEDMSHKYIQFKTFYKKLKEIPSTEVNIPRPLAIEIRTQLSEIVEFLNTESQNHIMNAGVQPLRFYSRRAWALSRDATHEYKTMRKKIIITCMRVFRRMFGIKSFEACRYMNIRDGHDRVVYPCKLSYAILGVEYQPHIRRSELGEFMEIRELYLSIHALFAHLSRYGLQFRPHDLLNDARSTLERLIDRYPTLHAQLETFVDSMWEPNTALSWQQAKHLFVDVLGPYFALYQPSIPNRMLVWEYRKVSEKCIKYGRFAEFGDFLGHFSVLVATNPTEYQDLFDSL